MSELSPALLEFIAQPNVATLATIRKNGVPSQTAVWYLYEDGVVKIPITDTRAKYKHVQRDPRISLAICGHELPYKEVVFEGRGELIHEGGHELFRRLAIHYYGEEDGARYAEYDLNTAQSNRVVLALHPEKIRTWDFAVEDDYHQPWEGDTFDPTVPAARES